YSCAIATCTSGGGATWQDCDSSYANGCETNVNNSLLHCGGCVGSGGQSCAALMNIAANNIASIICDAGACRITGCNAGYADCDNNPNNGCEVNTNTSTNRCGGCLSSDPRPGSGETCSTKWAHANGSCSGGSCSFTGCHTNWGNCMNGLTDGCETDLRVTTAHCGACGAACQNNSYTSTNSCS